MLSKQSFIFAAGGGAIAVAMLLAFQGKNDAERQVQQAQQQVQAAEFNKRFDAAWANHHGQTADPLAAQAVDAAKAELAQAKAEAAVAKAQAESDIAEVRGAVELSPAAPAPATADDARAEIKRLTGG